MKQIDQAEDIKSMIGANREENKKKHRVRWIVISVILLMVVLGGIYGLGRKGSEKIDYVTQEVEKGDLTITVTASGTLKPTNQVDISSELSGTVRAVLVDYNDKVKSGQILAKLDSTALDAKVMQAKAALATAEAKLDEAEVTVEENTMSLNRLKQLRKLSDNRAMSENDIETAEANLARAKAQLAMANAQIIEAKASLRLTETDLKKTDIYSPIDGIVLSRALEIGQTVAASLQAPVLFTLAEDLKNMELHVDVDEADVGTVKEGQHAVFTVDAYAGKNFPAHISQVRYAAQTVGGVVTYETILTVDNSELFLRPGMTATADIVVKEAKDAILVPNAALRFSPDDGNDTAGMQGGLFRALMPRLSRRGQDHTKSKDKEKAKTRIWILKNEALVPVFIKIGETDGRMTEVLEGDVKPGMAVVTDTKTISK
ncbi:MAG: efflux RND transporter periplasmic adaptor subunit [Proteobacteria bacterium]|nr:efflux RND transporter periplasmic adaptor subunit [Pseudomonadota bacterium]